MELNNRACESMFCQLQWTLSLLFLHTKKTLTEIRHNKCHCFYSLSHSVDSPCILDTSVEISLLVCFNFMRKMRLSQRTRFVCCV